MFKLVIQGWRSGESTGLPPLWPGFDSWTRRQTWVEFVVGSRTCSASFFPGSPVFVPPQKPTPKTKFQFDPKMRATGLSALLLVSPSLNKVDYYYHYHHHYYYTSIPQIMIYNITNARLFKRFSKLHMIIWSRIKQTFAAKNTLSTTEPALTKPFVEVAKEECRLEILRRIGVRRSGRSDLQHDVVYSKTNSLSVDKTRNGVAFTVWLRCVHFQCLGKIIVNSERGYNYVKDRP